MADFYSSIDEADLEFHPYVITIDYPSEDEIITIQNNGTGDNDQKTMTDEQMQAHGGGSNTPASSLQDIVLQPLTVIKDTAVKAAADIADTLKIPITAVTIGALLIGGYYLLDIFANLKRNVKTIKAKK
jgi:hypothetical protein